MGLEQMGEKVWGEFSLSEAMNAPLSFPEPRDSPENHWCFLRDRQVQSKMLQRVTEFTAFPFLLQIWVPHGLQNKQVQCVYNN